VDTIRSWRVQRRVRNRAVPIDGDVECFDRCPLAGVVVLEQLVGDRLTGQLVDVLRIVANKLGGIATWGVDVDPVPVRDGSAIAVNSGSVDVQVERVELRTA